MEYGLVGETLRHSYSERVHALIGDYPYGMLELPPDEFDAFISAGEYKALNITIPYKKRVMPLLDLIDGDAISAGAVNTVVNRGGRLCGYNTDVPAMAEAIVRAGIDIRGKTVLILGTGGTSATAKAVCEKEGAVTVTVSRTPRGGEISYDAAEKTYAEKEIVIINTTPVGMFTDSDRAPIELGSFCRVAGVFDAIYNPVRTVLVSEAEKRGISCAGGMYMLARQAVLAAELFFDRKYPEGLAERITSVITGEKTNVVLTGMPSCGKSTVGKRLSELTGREFLDTDVIFENKYGEKPGEYIRGHGEADFREKEAEIVRDVAKRSGAVIATGGGAVLRAENVAALRRNGRLFFIDRPLCELTSDTLRPLSDSAEKLARMYADRLPVYKSAADDTVAFNGDETAKEIILKMEMSR